MAAPRKRNRKAFTSSFVLAPDKLRRLVDIATESFKEASLAFDTPFSATLRDDREVTTDRIDEILSLDNTIRNPIKELQIEFVQRTIADKGDVVKARCLVAYDSDNYRNLMVLTEADDARWSSTLTSKMEEQLRRTSVTNWFRPTVEQKLWLIPGVMLALTGLLLGAGGLDSIKGLGSSLRPSDIDDLYKTLPQMSTTEAKSEWVFPVYRRLIENAHASAHSTVWTRVFHGATTLGARSVFIAIPLFIVVGALLYLCVYCHPHAVFNWGDYADHYTSIVSRRRTIWTVLIISLVIGIVGNVFVFGLSSYFK